MKKLGLCLAICTIIGFTSCQRNLCPAYNGLTHNNQFNPNIENKEYKSNKDKVEAEAKKNAELNPKSNKKGRSSLFPKGFRVRSR